MQAPRVAAATPNHGLGDWASLLALTAMWGSSFLFTKLAVTALPVEWVVTARLAIGATVLVPLAALLGRSVPRGPRLWLFFGLIAVVGNLLPFSLITWGQRAIDSGLAGILMAVMPLATLGLAHLFVPGERLTGNRVAGFLTGFLGVVVLIGPQALLAAGGDRGPLLPMLAVLAGALCYGTSAIIARLRPPSDALTTAAATIGLAALLSVPLGLDTWPQVRDGLAVMTPAVAGALLFLGLFSTATAMVVYFRLIRRAGPSFTAQLNYLIPLWAVAVGVLFLGEQPTLGHLFGLLLILAGILWSRRPPRSASTEPTAASLPTRTNP
ncbi:MAG: DMT family transporter [Thiohalocapsa sp.]|uniref:DMT family transporter n=1 Tax=Thiohalocapsa sp. TaxID=2497641 RepID=UPI0025FA14CB|nr:DMT family transporter [Thiohalocapsa sp.]MCG6941694.1 DMT family transporter [Thiohalocapsa sp.]